MKHMTDGSGVAHTPDFDKHVAEYQRAEAQILKQERLAREERTLVGHVRRHQPVGLTRILGILHSAVVRSFARHKVR